MASITETSATEKAPHVDLQTEATLAENTFGEDEEVIVGWRTWMAAIAGASCVFSGYYTGLMLGNTGAILMTEFGKPNLATWMPNAYAVVTASIAGLVSSCSDIIGRKWILMGGLFIAMLGDIIIAASQSSGVAILGATLCSGIFVNQGNFFSVPAEVLPRRFRGVGATITVSAGGFGALLSLMFTGATITNNTGGLGWRSGYILGACLHVVCMVLIFVFYRPIESPKDPGITTFTALRTKVDWLGAFILAAGIGLFMIGLTWGGVSYPWSSPHVLSVLIIGAALCGVLALHQIFVNKHGILDHDLWTRNFMVAGFGCLVEGVIFFSFLLFFPLENVYLGWETRTFYLNARLLAFFVLSAVVAPFVGLYTRHTRDLKWPLLAGWGLVLISNIIFTSMGAGANSVSIGALVICGVGFATPLALLFAAAQLATPPHLLGLATGQIIACRAVGQAFGASILEAIFFAKVAGILPPKVAAAALDAGLPASSIATFVTGIASGNTTLIESTNPSAAVLAASAAAATDAYVQSFRYGWGTSVAFVAVAFLSVFALSGRKMKEQMTWVVERPVSTITHINHGQEVDVERRHSFLRRASKDSTNARRPSLKLG